MSASLNFKPAGAMSLSDLVSAFNAGFAGYFYPPQMNVEMLARRVRMEHLDLLQSVLAFREEVNGHPQITQISQKRKYWNRGF